MSLPRSSAAFAAAVLCAFTAGGAADQAEQAADDVAKTVTAERILRWWEYGKQKVFTPPAGEPPPRLYARVVFGKKHPVPGVLAFSCGAIGSYFPGERTWIVDGETMRMAPEFGKTPPNRRKTLEPSGNTPWIEISAALHYGYRDVFRAEARNSTANQRMPNGTTADFRIEFSKDGKTPFASFSNGGGEYVTALVSLAHGTVEDDVSMSREDLRLAVAAGKKPPQRPRRFAVKISNLVYEKLMTPEAFTNELKVLRLLGANDMGSEKLNGILDPRHAHEPEFLFRDTYGGHVGARRLGCICSPDLPNITNAFKRLRESCAEPISRGKKIVVCIMDEPHYPLSALTNCHSTAKTCRERFGKDFCLDGSDTKLFLETVAYRDKIVCDFWRAIADAARAVHTNILVTANVGISLVFSGNAGAGGTSPFMLADSGAITFGQTEDWCNVQRTRQFSSYMCDVWRAATERNGLDFAMCSIIMSGPETEAKAFAEVGHGAKALTFFCYGPHWLSGDSRNRNPWTYTSIRRFNSALAAAEDSIVGAKVAKGDAALFFSESGDRLEILPGEKRDWLERNPYGKDRMSASLMLSHCGVRTDVLDEKAVVDGTLDGYKVLFATDRCLRRTAIRAIAAWMRRGGILVKTREALTADQFGESLPEDAFERFGRVITLDFSPWKDYVRSLREGKQHYLGGCYSHRAFDMKVLAKMKAAVKEVGVVRRIWTDVPLVDAALLEKKASAVVVLSNWTPEESKMVKVIVSGVRPVRVRSATGAKLKWRRTGDGIEIETVPGWGDFIMLE